MASEEKSIEKGQLLDNTDPAYDGVHARDLMAENKLEISFNGLTRNYEGFFVVHDPTQDISTVDLTTYLVLGAFAR